jgi:hypothetical protein
MTPQARSLGWLRDHGFIAESVEKYAPFPDFKSHPCLACGQRKMIPRRVDLFNAFDILAVRECVHFIQVTTGANSANRMQKMMAHPDVAPNVLKALRGGVRISVHSWYKNAKGRWELTERPITEGMIAQPVLALVATEVPF